jgi:cytochrome c biogenesis protein CcdA
MRRSFRYVAITSACCLSIGLCLIVAGMQIRQVARRFGAWERRHEPIPAFGQADVVYFYEPTCSACEVASPTVLALRRRYPRYRIARVDSSTPAGIALQEEYNLAYAVPPRDRDRVPAAFAGRRFFIGASAIVEDLPASLQAAPPARPSRRLRPDQRGHVTLTQRFRSLGLVPVVVAALVDSINPCAIATLIFFLSYLTWGGHSARDLVWIGGLFTLGVFLTYSLIGLGLLQVVRSLQAVPLLARGLYPVAAVLTLALAAVSFRDYTLACRGKTAQVTLQLPRALKQRLHQVIRGRFASALGARRSAPGSDKSQRALFRSWPYRAPSAERRALPSLAVAAFGTAVIVSVLEFTCTSQVYLPTLVYMAQAGDQRLRATALLLLYNLIFVLPLILLFLAAALGMSTRSLAKLAARHTATARLAMSLLFIGFSIYLFKVSMQLFVPG